MPAAPIEPLVSISKVEARRSWAIGWTETGAPPPPIVAFTEAGSILAPPTARAVRMAETPEWVTGMSLRDGPPGAGAWRHVPERHSGHPVRCLRHSDRPGGRWRQDRPRLGEGHDRWWWRAGFGPADCPGTSRLYLADRH